MPTFDEALHLIAGGSLYSRKMCDRQISNEEIFLNVLEGRKCAVIERKSEKIIKEKK